MQDPEESFRLWTSLSRTIIIEIEKLHFHRIFYRYLQAFLTRIFERLSEHLSHEDQQSLIKNTLFEFGSLHLSSISGPLGSLFELTAKQSFLQQKELEIIQEDLLKTEERYYEKSVSLRIFSFFFKSYSFLISWGNRVRVKYNVFV